jgi:hypothetical protein
MLPVRLAHPERKATGEFDGEECEPSRSLGLKRLTEALGNFDSWPACMPDYAKIIDLGNA